MTLSPGHVLENRYRIIELLGQGGFGAVYRAWDTRLNGQCAVKECLDMSPESLSQFNREASLLFNLKHANLPKVTDSFLVPGQAQYLVMEFIEGEDLAMVLKRQGPLSETQIAVYILPVCDALTYLHTRHPPVIHRDIKPANIRVTPASQVALVDFGIAKEYDPAAKTTRGARAVTPGYSPPEQYGLGKTDERSDIYSLGATLYALLTGIEPPESVDIISGLVSPPAPVGAFRPDLPERVSMAIERTMQIDRNQRFASVDEFRQNLVAPAKFQRLTTERIVVPSSPVAPTVTAIPPLGLHSKRPINWLAALAGVLALIVVVVIGALLLNNLVPENPTPVGALSTLVTQPATRTSLPAISSSLPASQSPVTSTPISEPTSPVTLHSPTETQSSTWRQGKLAYVQREGVGTSLYVLDLAGSADPMRIVQSSGRISAPAFSPDGARIAYHLFGGEASGWMFVTNAAADAQPVQLGRCLGATWSSDGTRILCWSTDGDWFDVGNVDSGAWAPERVSVSGSAYAPCWSPTRDEFIFALFDGQSTQIWRSNLDGSDQRMLAGQAVENYIPSYSADGEWIAYQSNLQSELSEIWIMDREGGFARQITDSPPSTWSRSPVWSPDGQWLAFVSSMNGSATADFGELFIISQAGGTLEQISHTGGRIYDWGLSWR